MLRSDILTVLGVFGEFFIAEKSDLQVKLSIVYDNHKYLNYK